MKVGDLFLIVLSAFILGINYVAVKVGVQEFPPLFMVALRFIIVAGILIWFAKPPGRYFPAVLLFSFTMGFMHFGLIFIGFQHVDTSLVAIIFQLGVPFSIIFARIFLGELFGWRRWGGIAIAFAGAGLIAGAPQGASNLIYILVIIAAMIAWAIASIQIRRMPDYDAISLSAWMAVLATPQLLIVSAIFESGQLVSLTNASWVAWSGLLFTAIGASIIGYGLWYHMIAKYSVGQIMPFGFIAPISAVASAIVILDDQLSTVTIFGALLILGGVIIVQWRSRPSPQQSDNHDPAPFT